MAVRGRRPPWNEKKTLSGKTQGIWFAQVVNSLILKVKDISILAAKISNYISKLDKSAKSVLCMLYNVVTNDVNWHRTNLWSDREKPGNI